MVEFAIIVTVVAVLLIFICNMGVALDHETNSRDLNYALTRHLAASLGKVWSTGMNGASAWDGNCGNYLRSAGNDFLAARSPDYSMSNPAAKYYFGASIDNHSAIIINPNSPYVILRIVGSPQLLQIGSFALPPLFTTSSSVLVEYHGEPCVDYP